MKLPEGNHWMYTQLIYVCQPLFYHDACFQCVVFCFKVYFRVYFFVVWFLCLFCATSLFSFSQLHLVSSYPALSHLPSVIVMPGAPAAISPSPCSCSAFSHTSVEHCAFLWYSSVFPRVIFLSLLLRLLLVFRLCLCFILLQLPSFYIPILPLPSHNLNVYFFPVVQSTFL